MLININKSILQAKKYKSFNLNSQFLQKILTDTKIQL